jgi:hypothetical protein
METAVAKTLLSVRNMALYILCPTASGKDPH